MSSLPPVTAAVVAKLRTALNPLPVATSVPATRPGEFAVVTATGGAVVNMAQASPTFTIELWAASSVRAEQLARQAWAVLDAADGSKLNSTTWVAQTRLTLPVDYPDAISDTPRWVFVYAPTINLIP